MRKRLYLSPPHMSGEERMLVEAVFESNWIAPTGPMVTAFEQSIADYTGISHVAALSSGTAALHLALRLAEVEPGDQVWCPTMTFIGGVAPILYQGATPVFFDCDPHCVIDLDLLEEALRRARRTGRPPNVVITADLYGATPDLIRMQRLAQDFEFAWISDSAEALGSRCGASHAGRGSRFAIFSFNGNKIITTSGGGALASDDPEPIERAVFLSTQARDAATHYEHSTFGYNYRLSNVCAAIGLGQMHVLQERVAARRRIYELYRHRLLAVPGLAFDIETSEAKGNRWLTTVQIDRAQNGMTPESIRLALESEDIESRPLWKPMHLQPLFKDAMVHGGSVSEKLFQEGLCLPSGSAMGEAEVDRVCAVIEDSARKAFRKMSKAYRV